MAVDLMVCFETYHGAMDISLRCVLGHPQSVEGYWFVLSDDELFLVLTLIHVLIPSLAHDVCSLVLLFVVID
jgi:hypothetical protein